MDIGQPLDSARFHSLQYLTKGSYGQILVAQDHSNPSKEVVIKKIPKTGETQRIACEILANRHIPLSNKGMCKYHGFFESNNSVYLVFDRLRGGDLFQLMERREFVPLPEAVIRSIMNRVLRTLVHAHNHGVAHRDVKLENIVVDSHLKNAHLIDFGLCSFFEIQNGRETLSTDRCGSIEYLAPEILKETPFEATKVDAWSFGVTVRLQRLPAR